MRQRWLPWRPKDKNTTSNLNQQLVNPVAKNIFLLSIKNDFIGSAAGEAGKVHRSGANGCPGRRRV